MGDDGVFLAYCHPDHVDARFHDCVIALIVHDGGGPGHIIGKGGWCAANSSPRIASTRNELVRKFLGAPGKPAWLLMVDTDMTFKPDLVDRLLETADPTERPIVGALCFGGGKGPRLTPTLYRHVANPEHKFHMDPLVEFNLGDVVRVDATGAACLLIHRKVLTAVGHRYAPVTAYPWFAETEKDLKEIGEDVTFCLRAGMAGFPVHVDTSIVTGHRKVHELDIELWKQYRADVGRLGSEDAVLDEYAQRLVLV